RVDGGVLRGLYRDAAGGGRDALADVGNVRLHRVIDIVRRQPQPDGDREAVVAEGCGQRHCRGGGRDRRRIAGAEGNARGAAGGAAEEGGPDAGGGAVGGAPPGPADAERVRGADRHGSDAGNDGGIDLHPCRLGVELKIAAGRHAGVIQVGADLRRGRAAVQVVADEILADRGAERGRYAVLATRRGDGEHDGGGRDLGTVLGRQADILAGGDPSIPSL